MNARSGIGALLFVGAVLLAANTAWAQTCSTGNQVPLPACVLKGLSKSPTTLGNFVQWYEVENHCGRDVDVYIRVSNGSELVLRLEDGRKEGASLPEGMEVDELLCCSERLSCDGSG